MARQMARFRVVCITVSFVFRVYIHCDSPSRGCKQFLEILFPYCREGVRAVAASWRSIFDRKGAAAL